MSRSLLLVRKDRPRPSRNIASRMEVLPAPFSPAMRLSSGENSSAADSMQRRFSMRSSARDIGAAGFRDAGGLQPHRHHDVFAVRDASSTHQAAAVSIGQAENDLFGIHGSERIEQ